MYNVNLLLFSLHFEGLKNNKHLEDLTNSDRGETILIVEVEIILMQDE